MYSLFIYVLIFFSSISNSIFIYLFHLFHLFIYFIYLFILLFYLSPYALEIFCHVDCGTLYTVLAGDEVTSSDLVPS